MAESISEGTLTALHKQVGEDIEADEELASIETDKVDVPINAPQAGQIMELFVSEGDLVKVGQDVAVLETQPGASAESSSHANEVPPQQSQSTPVEEPKQPTTTPSPTTGPLFRKESTNKETSQQNDSLKPGERVVRHGRQFHQAAAH